MDHSVYVKVVEQGALNRVDQSTIAHQIRKTARAGIAPNVHPRSRTYAEIRELGEGGGRGSATAI